MLNDGHDWAVDYWALGVLLFEMTSGLEPFAAKNPMETYKQIVSGHVEIPSYFSSTLSELIRKLLNISKSKRLGRTMGGGGAVMQHRWYSDYDFDAHLEKRLAAPLKPKTQEILSGDSVVSPNLPPLSFYQNSAINIRLNHSSLPLCQCRQWILIQRDLCQTVRQVRRKHRREVVRKIVPVEPSKRQE